MKIRATLRVRNAAMLEARGSIGITQVQLAELAEVSVQHIIAMEQMDFSQQCTRDSVPTVAGLLNLEPHVIMPEELAGVDAKMDAVRTCDMAPQHLVDIARNRPLMLDMEINPADRAIAKATVTELIRCLTDRERRIIADRYWNGASLEGCGQKYGITRERVRQIECGALRKMTAKATGNIIDAKEQQE